MELELIKWDVGQHTNEVLKDMVGMSEADIENLRSEGVVA